MLHKIVVHSNSAVAVKLNSLELFNANFPFLYFLKVFIIENRDGVKYIA